MQKASKTTANASNLPGFSLTAHVASVKAEGKSYAVVAVAMGVCGGPELEGVVLHWACVSGQGQEWEQPPPGWHTDPDYSQAAGTKPLWYQATVCDAEKLCMYVWGTLQALPPGVLQEHTS